LEIVYPRVAAIDVGNSYVGDCPGRLVARAIIDSNYYERSISIPSR
jgi:hypothetical protein